MTGRRGKQKEDKSFKGVKGSLGLEESWEIVESLEAQHDMYFMLCYEWAKKKVEELKAFMKVLETKS